MQITEKRHADPFSKLEEMLRQGDDVTRRKLAEKGASGAMQEGFATQDAQAAHAGGILPPMAADEADRAYGAAMDLLGGNTDSGLAQHALDPDRVAALLGL
ncbi:hypothetical protein [Desulfovibrio psychrotolerans]|uniref:Uncharacterized protein n=1 Tax=Desulfovibrio psychrotolerans TaxID=415242 RepID=A0A7J0BRV2_9BACT|nr:hypothetical protein [Desulfovibrio psychrotolerans]GFM36409.1 hypothetical protein DSM19430T_10930 [Desulfovibrio psychrotolerans]